MEQCTEMGFVSFLSGGSINALVVTPLERKLAKRTGGPFALLKFCLFSNKGKKDQLWFLSFRRTK